MSTMTPPSTGAYQSLEQAFPMFGNDTTSQLYLHTSQEPTLSVSEQVLQARFGLDNVDFDSFQFLNDTAFFEPIIFND